MTFQRFLMYSDKMPMLLRDVERFWEMLRDSERCWWAPNKLNSCWVKSLVPRCTSYQNKMDPIDPSKVLSYKYSCQRASLTNWKLQCSHKSERVKRTCFVQKFYMILYTTKLLRNLALHLTRTVSRLRWYVQDDADWSLLVTEVGPGNVYQDPFERVNPVL